MASAVPHNVLQAIENSPLSAHMPPRMLIPASTSASVACIRHIQILAICISGLHSGEREKARRRDCFSLHILRAPRQSEGAQRLAVCWNMFAPRCTCENSVTKQQLGQTLQVREHSSSVSYRAALSSQPSRLHQRSSEGSGKVQPFP